MTRNITHRRTFKVPGYACHDENISNETKAMRDAIASTAGGARIYENDAGDLFVVCIDGKVRRWECVRPEMIGRKS